MAVPNVDVNYLAVLVAAIVSIVIGSLWYSPILFGNIWIKLSKFTKKDMNKARKKGMGKQYLGQLIGSLILACVLAHFVAYVSASTLSDAAQLGFWLWLGFIVPVQLGTVLWEGKPVKLYILNIAYHLVTLIAMAIVIVLM